MVRRAPQPFNDGQMDLVVAALEGVFLVLNDSQHTFHTAKAVREMLGNKRSTRSGGTVYELPTLLLMQQIFATAKCRKVSIRHEMQRDGQLRLDGYVFDVLGPQNTCNEDLGWSRQHPRV